MNALDYIEALMIVLRSDQSFETKFKYARIAVQRNELASILAYHPEFIAWMKKNETEIRTIKPTQLTS